MQQAMFRKFGLVALTVVAMSGCASKGGSTDEAATTEAAQEQPEVQTQAVPESPEVAVETTAADQNLDKTVVYFEFDRAELTEEGKMILMAHAQYLAANAQASVKLAGHCDERGTVEYNLALGERRAESAKRYMIVQGANPSQLDTVSFGEERPAVAGSDESAWSQNRRVEVKYITR
jgi:peptidoglycan-associated lipoprotein